MTSSKLILAASLGLVLAACGGSGQQAEGTADSGASIPAGEMPQADDTGTVTGATDTGTAAADITGTAGVQSPPATTSADAGAMGEGNTMGEDVADPMSGTGDQLTDPRQQTDPALEGTTSDPQQSASPPPPMQ